MSIQCDKCKHYLREDGGCTHCERSNFLTGPLKEITELDAEKILSEPVVVYDKNRRSVQFVSGKLLGEGAHIHDDKSKANYKRRVKNLLYAIDSVKKGKSKTFIKIGKDGIGRERTKYFNRYIGKDGKPFKMLVLADKVGMIREVFTFYDD